jgi:hypothetical protein
MSPPPPTPQIFHITHVDNLAGILATGGLSSDAAMIARGGPQVTIGMSKIKQRRLTLPVHCHPGDRVGDYVPFYFCPRSIMLYLMHRGNHPELAYQGGQGPIIHLQASLQDVVQWAGAAGGHWAFSLSNAGAYYASFHSSLADLHHLDWQAIAALDFRSPTVKDGKQAEFLVRDFLPWTLVTHVGVHSSAILKQVTACITRARVSHVPLVSIEPRWYY